MFSRAYIVHLTLCTVFLSYKATPSVMKKWSIKRAGLWWEGSYKKLMGATVPQMPTEQFFSYIMARTSYNG